MATLHFIKDVRRDKATKDWAAFITVDGVTQYLGNRATRALAEALVDDFAYELLRDEMKRAA
jgi:hypothetical protein